MNSTTFIITVYNEGPNLEKTLKSLRSSVRSGADIIVVNDFSTDSWDYQVSCNKYNATLINNDIRFGVAASRELGIETAKTEFVFITDAHMKFPTDNWLTKIEKRIKENPRGIYCTTSVKIDCNFNYIENKNKLRGAYIVFESSPIYQPLTPVFFEDNKKRHEIPCILGANYAMSKEYYNRIGGLKGLQHWGGDELLLSAKTFIEGGTCFLINEIEIGHLYREKFPYSIDENKINANKIFIAKSLFENPHEYLKMLTSRMKNPETALSMIDENEISHTRELISKIKSRNMIEFIQFNNYCRFNS
ncbi:glycosyltransferase [Rheinheimera texasensis]|uniref:glycosyltransferase n=1 Tax=Rheinheimera texasensis TaxID=306205 RepID=UPI0032B237EE